MSRKPHSQLEHLTSMVKNCSLSPKLQEMTFIDPFKRCLKTELFQRIFKSNLISQQIIINLLDKSLLNPYLKTFIVFNLLCYEAANVAELAVFIFLCTAHQNV